MELSKKDRELRLKLSPLLPLLDEKQRRILIASEAKAYGHGGVQRLSQITGTCRQTIYRGLEELKKKPKNDGRVRNPGGGRKKISEKDPKLVEILEEIVSPGTRGDPENPLRWTCKSVRNLCDCLEKKGYSISRQTVSNILHELDYSLQANRKTSEGKKDHPDRDDQFEYINSKSKSFLRRSLPVISVDTKKKELVGKYKNQGLEWEKKKDPTKVLSHDFPDPKVSKAVPYGVYDIGDNKGWVNIGVAADTAEFAVESIRQWWKRMGRKRYPKAKQLLICADSGGSNGYRIHLWKYELQRFCDQEGLNITVCHFPPGTSKWNKIEHRLFSYISINWRGKPLTDYKTIVDLISSTKTKSSLTVKVRLDNKKYKKGRSVSKDEFEKLKIKKHSFHGEWNYTIKSRKRKSV